MNNTYKIENLKLSKNKKKVLIIFDNNTTIKVPLDIVYSYRLQKGKTITSETFSKIQKEANLFNVLREAYQKATSSLKSRSQLKKILQNKGYPEDEVETTIAKLEELKIIDDEKYALSVLEYLSNKKKYGINRIRQYLIKKGVSKEIIEGVIARASILNNQNEIIISFYERNISKIQRKSKLQRIPYTIRMFRTAGFLNENIKYFLSKYKKQLLEL